MTGLTEITLGFIPLLDSALLIAAFEKGFAEDEGLALTLVRETSWANIRDRLAVGHFQAAHMLAPMPIASNLGLTPLSIRLLAPMAMGLGGNAVTVSTALHAAMQEKGAGSVIDAAQTGQALKAVIAARAEAGAPILRFAVVHPFSGHNYELRYWLAACGIAPDRDIEIVIVPPPLMADALRMGTIDGYCVGEPWNSVAVAEGSGCLATVKAAIWQASPEKVLGVDAQWAASNPEALEALIRAMVRAALWCEKPENRAELAALLAQKQYLGLSEARLLPALIARLPVGGGVVASVPDFFIPYAKAATFPWQSHALWFYSQMIRWGHAARSPANQKIACDSYRPDLYRKAVKPLGIPVPGASLKVEGALKAPLHAGASQSGLVLGPDGFFDGRIFDPELFTDYIDALKRQDAAL
jgi:two-component system, oxyanion-binding sensor